jgi:hypothetical protein
MDDRQLDRHCFSEPADDELSRGGIDRIELSSRRRDDGNGQEGVSLLCKTRLVISNEIQIIAVMWSDLIPSRCEVSETCPDLGGTVASARECSQRGRRPPE